MSEQARVEQVISEVFPGCRVLLRNPTLFQRPQVKRHRRSSFVDRVLLSYASPKVKKVRPGNRACVEERSVVVKGIKGYVISLLLYYCSSFKDLCLKTLPPHGHQKHRLESS